MKEIFKSALGRRKCFGRSRDGAAAVEFAIVSPIFLGLMFSMFEVGWFFYTNSIVDAATDRAARMIRTGQIQENATLTTPQDQFDFLYNEICKVTVTWGECSTRLTVEVQTFMDFASLAAATAPPTCADSPPDEIAAIPFQPGIDLQIIRVRVCQIYDTINPAIGANLSEGDQGQRHLISTVIFQNEPFTEGT